VADQEESTSPPQGNSRADAEMPRSGTKINLIRAGAFAYLTKRHKLQVHVISVRDIDLALNSSRTKEE